MNKPTCRWPECERPAEKRGLCERDYERARRKGDFEEPWLSWRKIHQCRWPECPEDAKVRGLCGTHYARARAVQDFERPWEHWSPVACEECGVEFTPTRRQQRSICSAACRLTRWKRENADRNAENHRRWHERNRERVVAKAAQWAADNPEARREASRANAAKRRAAKRGAFAETITVADIRRAHGDDCYLCGRTIDYSLRHPDPASPSIDHIVPLSKGGAHLLANVAMTHLTCNIRKGAAVLPPLRKVF